MDVEKDKAANDTNVLPQPSNNKENGFSSDHTENASRTAVPSSDHTENASRTAAPSSDHTENASGMVVTSSEGEPKPQEPQGPMARQPEEAITEPVSEVPIGTSEIRCEVDVGNRKAEDDVDKASIFSLYMDKDFRYVFQHPYLRLAIAYFVTFCNFLIYAEDPVAHSKKECFIPVVGHCFSFVCTKYPPNGWAVLKVFLWLTAIVCGMFAGKLLVHKQLFNNRFRLKMFRGEQGSWMVMFFTTIVSLFIFCWVYNAFLLIGGESTVPWRISSLMGIKNSWFMKAAACGTWCGDFFTAWMVTDIILQEKLYPHWAKPFRCWWNNGYRRIICFWVMVLISSTLVVMVISTNWIQWDKLNRDFLPTNELSRGFLASFILVMDLLIIMQDWDFPYFINNLDIKLPGLNRTEIKLFVPQVFRKEQWMVHITGKWFNYGIIFMVMLLDLNMWKNQIFYSPFEYGQYVGPEGRIYTVLDKESLNYHNESMVTYEWRSNTTNPLTNRTYTEDDKYMNSQFLGFRLALKGLAFVPSLACCLCFGILIWYFGRWKPTPADPYAGRLMKRTKKRWIFSRRWRSKKQNSAGPDVVSLTKVQVTGDDGTVAVYADKTTVGTEDGLDTVDGKLESATNDTNTV